MCQWTPPEDSPFASEYEGCPHPAEPGRADGLCIFHIPLAEKNQNPELAQKFRERFFELYHAGKWDFTGFEFPDGFRFGKKEKGFYQPCDFQRPHEKEGRKPREGENTKPVSFQWASFGDYAEFRGASFGDYADFLEASFGDYAYFRGASFGDYADFREATFGDYANFRYATFGDYAYFREATFGDYADFLE